MTMLASSIPPTATENHWRDEFPAFEPRTNENPMVFLDSAATTQKPRSVLEAMEKAYRTRYANVHRGGYRLSYLATEDYERARRAVQGFLNAESPESIVFAKNATEAINLVAHSYVAQNLKKGDVLLLSIMEHHANFVPWLMLRDKIGLELRVIGLSEDGSLDVEHALELLDERVKFVALTHVSNVLGTVNPVERLVRAAHAADAKILIDGSQAAPHMKIDLASLNPDFYVFTAHKIYGPCGIGVLYGKESLLESMPPFLGGGEMIKSVNEEGFIPAELPAKFEAGTPPLIEATGLAAAIEYLAGIDLDAAHRHERALLEQAHALLQEIKGLRVYGTTPDKAPIVSFALDGIHPHDVSTLLDAQGVAVRAGFHCAEPLHKRLGVHGLTRASIGLYNTQDDIDKLVRALNEACLILRP